MTVERLARELAAHLSLTRPLVCVDLEATGLSVERDRIVQIALARVAPDGSVNTWSSLVNPEQPIPLEATEVHGVSDAMVASAPTFAEITPMLTSLLTGCDLTGYNIERFDRRMLGQEFRRAGVADPLECARIVDAYTIFVRQESRSLDAALRFYGVETDESRRAHEANSDAEAAIAVLVAQLKAYPEMPRTVDGLHGWLFPAHPERIDADSKLVWRNGAATIGFGAQVGRSLEELATNDRGFLEWILRKDFSADVKAIVSDALAGRFPAPPALN